jgi:hypothetical protein
MYREEYSKDANMTTAVFRFERDLARTLQDYFNSLSSFYTTTNHTVDSLGTEYALSRELTRSSPEMPNNASSSTSHIKHYKPYFAPSEVERLSAKQRGKLSVSREERGRQQACAFIDAVGVRSGL